MRVWPAFCLVILLCGCEAEYTPRWRTNLGVGTASGAEVADGPAQPALSATSELLRRWSEQVDETLWHCLVSMRMPYGGICGVSEADCSMVRQRGETCQQTRNVACLVYKHPGRYTGYSCWQTMRACQQHEEHQRSEERPVLLPCTEIRLFGTRQPYSALLSTQRDPPPHLQRR
jgi:hypothetical protein